MGEAIDIDWFSEGLAAQLLKVEKLIHQSQESPRILGSDAAMLHLLGQSQPRFQEGCTIKVSGVAGSCDIFLEDTVFCLIEAFNSSA